MPEQFPYMPFFGEDFFGSESVMAMSNDGQAVFMRMLWVQWTKGSVPKNPETVALLTKTRTKTVQKGWAEACKNFIETDGRLINVRLAELAEKRDKKSKTNKANGLAGGRPKKTERVTETITEKKANGFPEANRTQTETEPNPKPIQEEEKEREKKEQEVIDSRRARQHAAPAVTYGESFWEIFRTVQCFENGMPKAQLDGLAKLAADFDWIPAERLLAEAVRCRDHYSVKPRYAAKETTESESAAAKFRDWLNRARATIKAELGNGHDERIKSASEARSHW